MLITPALSFRSRRARSRELQREDCHAGPICLNHVRRKKSARFFYDPLNSGRETIIVSAFLSDHHRPHSAERGVCGDVAHLRFRKVRSTTRPPGRSEGRAPLSQVNSNSFIPIPFSRPVGFTMATLCWVVTSNSRAPADLSFATDYTTISHRNHSSCLARRKSGAFGRRRLPRTIGR